MGAEEILRRFEYDDHDMTRRWRVLNDSLTKCAGLYKTLMGLNPNHPTLKGARMEEGELHFTEGADPMSIQGYISKLKNALDSPTSESR